MHRKIKREHSDCVIMVGRHSESQHSGKEEHGSLIYCCNPCYKWTTRRMREMRRLRSRLNNAHHIEASTNCTPTEFRTATAQPLASSSSHHTNIDPDFASTPPLRYNDYALMPQAHQSQPDGSASYEGLQDKVAPQPEHSPAPSSSASSRTRVHVAPCRVFRPCRLRQRIPRAIVRTSSSGPPPTHQSSAMESTPRLYANEQDNSATFPQTISDAFDIELVASSLCSFSLGSLYTEPATNQ